MKEPIIRVIPETPRTARAFAEAYASLEVAHRELKRERAKAMDFMVDLMLENAQLRRLLREADDRH